MLLEISGTPSLHHATVILTTLGLPMQRTVHWAEVFEQSAAWFGSPWSQLLTSASFCCSRRCLRAPADMLPSTISSMSTATGWRGPSTAAARPPAGPKESCRRKDREVTDLSPGERADRPCRSLTLSRPQQASRNGFRIPLILTRAPL